MRFELTILGSSSALPTSERFPTAHVLNVHERFFLIDCGEGTQVQIRRLRIPLSRIHHIFISHLHGDHYYGLPGLIASMDLLGRRHPLSIYGPPDLERLVMDFSHLNEALKYELRFHALDPEQPLLILDHEVVDVWALPLKHKIKTHGFLFREKPGLPHIRKEVIDELGLSIRDIQWIKSGNDWISPEGEQHTNQSLTLPASNPRTYAYMSDTRFMPEAAAWVAGADLLYHEATYDHAHRKRAWATGHSTAHEAAELARLAQVKKLVIGHFSARFKTTDGLLSEAREVFSETVAACDGLKIPIGSSEPTLL